MDIMSALMNSSMAGSVYRAANPNIAKMSQIYDFKAAQKQTQSLINSYKDNEGKVSTLKKDSADFLNTYTKGMNALNTAAGKLTSGNVNRRLTDKSGQVTGETVKKTVDAVKNMVSEYNNTLKTLNGNAERGSGVMNQIARMSDDPAAKSSMEMVGVSVNKDGTLALDEEKLTAALSVENEDSFRLNRSVLSDVASGVQRDAQAGLNTSAQKLIENDLAEMRQIREEDPIRNFALGLRGSGAYALNNSAAVGMMMNMLV